MYDQDGTNPVRNIQQSAVYDQATGEDESHGGGM